MLCILLAVALVGFLAVLDRRDKRHHEEHQAHRLEIAGLVQRLQAPELAVAQYAQAQYEPMERTAVSELGMPLSDEEIAENLETIRRMERDANAALANGDQPWDGMS